MNLITNLLSILSLTNPNYNQISRVPGNNSLYVDGQSNLIWMPDGEEVPHVVNLKAPADETVLNIRNGAGNQYWLYTRLNPTNPQFIIDGNASTILSSNYNSKKPLKVIIHGWDSDGNSPMNPLVTSSFLIASDVNVIVVDWSAVAKNDYSTASEGALSVGEHLGQFLNWLIEITDGNWSQVHLVGFSLGAHVAGIAGRSTNMIPARVTGLDPVGPLWRGSPNSLNRNSGEYVDIIYTDGGVLGTFEDIGDVNLYANGGVGPQPGCTISTCSNTRSVGLFASGVRFGNLVGRLCVNSSEIQLMTCSGPSIEIGNTVNISSIGYGQYGVVTKASWPF